MMKKIDKICIIAVIASIVIALIISAYNCGYNDGYYDGRTDGSSFGYETGYEHGYEFGHYDGDLECWKSTCERIDGYLDDACEETQVILINGHMYRVNAEHW